MFCQVRGTVVAARLMRPAEGKAHRSIQVLQTENNDAVLVKVKDMELKEYGQGEPFDQFCRVTNWSFDGKSGMSVYVLNRMDDTDSSGGVV